MAVHCCATGLNELSACRSTFWAAWQDLLSEIGLEGWRLADVDGPQCAVNGEKILRIGNLLVAEKLGPSTVMSIAELAGRFTGSIPSACRNVIMCGRGRPSPTSRAGRGSGSGWSTRCGASRAGHHRRRAQVQQLLPRTRTRRRGGRSGAVPDGNRVSIAVAVASAPVLLATKGYAGANRLKRRDAYDIYYSVRNFPGGSDAFVVATGTSRNEREETPIPEEWLWCSIQILLIPDPHPAMRVW